MSTLTLKANSRGSWANVCNLTPAQLANVKSAALQLCLAANRWCARAAVRAFFRAVSRLGDGVFWYTLMAALVVFDGWQGLAVSAQLAATGVVALALYVALFRALTTYDDAEQIQGENLAAALSYAGVSVAIALVLAAGLGAAGLWLAVRDTARARRCAVAVLGMD